MKVHCYKYTFCAQPLIIKVMLFINTQEYNISYIQSFKNTHNTFHLYMHESLNSKTTCICMYGDRIKDIKFRKELKQSEFFS